MLESPCPFPLLVIGPLFCCDTARLTDGAERRRSRRACVMEIEGAVLPLVHDKRQDLLEA
jgi:hypothetical protein